MGSREHKSVTPGERPEASADAASPVGRSVVEERAGALEDAAERAEHERLAAFEKLARMVIMRRAQLGISQAELARRMDTSPSVVSRIESGQHPTNTATLKRIGAALQGRAVIGFDFATPDSHVDLVAL